MIIPYVDCKRLFNEELAALPPEHPLGEVLSEGAKQIINPILNRAITLEIPASINGVISTQTVAVTKTSEPRAARRWARAVGIAAKVFKTPRIEQAARAANTIVEDLSHDTSKIYNACMQCVDSSKKVVNIAANCGTLDVIHAAAIVYQAPMDIPYYTDEKPNVDADIQAIASLAGKKAASLCHPDSATNILATLKGSAQPIQPQQQTSSTVRLSTKGARILRVVFGVFRKNETCHQYEESSKNILADLATPEGLLRQYAACTCEKVRAVFDEAKSSCLALVNLVKEMATKK